MVYNRIKIIGQKLAAFLLIVSFVLPPFYLPAATPKTYAAGIPVIDIPEWVKKIIDAVAISIAQKMVDDMVRSTVKWANDGFDGNPAYVTDPENFFRNAASDGIAEYIDNENLEFLCSPFKAQVRLSLREQYIEPREKYQCTLDEIGVNLENFYNNFDEGGWDAWFKVTQEDQNNPYGAVIAAKLDIDNKLAEDAGLKRIELEANQGFRNFTTCVKRNPDFVPESVQAAWENYGGEALEVLDFLEAYPDWNPDKPPGACIEGSPILTSGATIKTQLDNALGSGLSRLVSIEHIEGLVGAFASGLLSRYVFGSKGTFGDSSAAAQTNEVIDIDDDDIPDGYDTDGDRELDICHHGLKKPPENLPTSVPWRPSNANCIGSTEVKSSPFFIPICSVTGETIAALESYDAFINRYEFDKASATTWRNRTMNAQNAVDNFMSTVGRYEIMAYDRALFTLGGYSGYLDDRIESLVEDGDLRGALPYDSLELILLRTNTKNTLDYMRQFQNGVKDRCDNPNTELIGELEPPVIGGTGAPQLSCYPSDSTVATGESVTWTVASSYPFESTNYTWFGDLPSGTELDELGPITVSYNTVGEKTVGIRANPEEGDSVSVQCSPLEVTDDKGN